MPAGRRTGGSALDAFCMPHALRAHRAAGIVDQNATARQKQITIAGDMAPSTATCGQASLGPVTACPAASNENPRGRFRSWLADGRQPGDVSPRTRVSADAGSSGVDVNQELLPPAR